VYLIFTLAVAVEVHIWAAAEALTVVVVLVASLRLVQMEPLTLAVELVDQVQAQEEAAALV
jgi:hypothetical protein